MQNDEDGLDTPDLSEVLDSEEPSNSPEETMEEGAQADDEGEITDPTEEQLHQAREAHDEQMSSGKDSSSSDEGDDSSDQASSEELPEQPASQSEGLDEGGEQEQPQVETVEVEGVEGKTYEVPRPVALQIKHLEQERDRYQTQVQSMNRQARVGNR